MSLRFFAFLLLLCPALALAQPTITSFTPETGAIGATVTITGTNFSATAANNVVFFGATQATVTSATTTQLEVTVPPGATFQPITVTVSGLTAYSSKPFIVTFFSVGVIDADAFAAQQTFDVGDAPQFVAVSDIDGDGKPDVIAPNRNDDNVSVLRYTGSAGSVSFDAAVNFAVVNGPPSVAIGDVDGDGKPDLAVPNFGSNDVSALRNTSSGAGNVSFAGQQTFAVGDQPWSVAVGDIDGDDKPDVIAANRLVDKVGALLNAIPSDAPPTVSALADTTIAEDATTGPLTVAIDDIDTATDALTLTVTSSNTALIPSAGVTLGGSGSSRTLTLTPAADRYGDAAITLTVHDGADSAAASFVLTVRPVNDPAIISALPTATLIMGNADSVAVTIADADTVGSAFLRYRAGGSQAWTHLPMTLDGSDPVTRPVLAMLPSEAVTDRGIELQVLAIDALGDTTLSPVGGRQTRIDSLSSAGAIALPTAGAGVPGDPLFQAEQQENFRMLSMPFALDDPQADRALAVLHIDDPEQARLLRWNGSVYDITTTTDMDPGKAYWVITTTPADLNIGPGLSSPTVAPLPVAVHPTGFTQIGTPYTFSVPYDSVVAHNPGLNAMAWQWTGTEYAPVTTLDPWQGYWVYNAGNETEITIPAIAADALPKQIAAKRAPTPGGWTLRVAAEAEGLADRHNYFGAAPDAADGPDRRDLIEPPPLMGGLTLAFVDAERPQARYAGDFRAAGQEGHTWTVRVQARANAPAQLSVLDMDRLPEGFEAVLIETEPYREIDLRQRQRVSAHMAEAGAARVFTLIVGTPGYIERARQALAPTTFALWSNYPNPFNPSTTIRFALPTASPVKLMVYNILGQQVDVLKDEEMAAGYHQVVWHGRNHSGRPVASGVYFYAIQAGTFSETKKMILLK